MSVSHNYSDPTLALGAEALRAFLRTEIAAFPNYLTMQVLLAGLDSARFFTERMVAAANARTDAELAARAVKGFIAPETRLVALAAGEIDPFAAMRLGARVGSEGHLVLAGRHGPMLAAEIRRRLSAIRLDVLPSEAEIAGIAPLLAGEAVAFLHLGVMPGEALAGLLARLPDFGASEILLLADHYFNYPGWRDADRPHALIEAAIARDGWQVRHLAFASAGSGVLLGLTRLG